MPLALPPAYLSTASAADQALDYNAAAFIPQFSSQVDPMASFYAQQTANSTATTRAGSLAATSSVIPKSFTEVQATAVSQAIVGAEVPQKMISKWIKGVKRDFIPLNIRAALYEPPKPDTPPTKVWPFGFDPIWSEDILSPPVDLVSIEL